MDIEETQSNKAVDLLAEKQAYRNALVNMCFCKRHICERCGYVKELPQRCVNEQVRDEVFHKQALKA